MNTITPITSISESILKYFKTEAGVLSIKEFNENHAQNTVKGLEVIKEQGGDLMDFVQSYRSFLSLPKPDKSLVNAQRLLDKVKVLMDLEDKNTHISFEISVDPEELELYIDEKLISQVLINLSKNALQSLAKQKNARVRIIAGIHRQGKKFIEVRDNGPGIPLDLIDEIFVPFFTTKNSGTGIGLSLSKQVMHLHGGNLQVRSVPHKETVFSMVFD